MKKILIFILCLILFFSLLAYKNSDPKIIISDLAGRKSLAPDGNLVYRLYLLGFIPMGEAVLGKGEIEEYAGKKVLHLFAQAQSQKFIAKLFRAYARIDSYLDPEQCNPVVFKQGLIISGKEEVIKEVVYDQANGVMTIDGIKRKIMPNTQDALSAVFNLRRIDFKTEKNFAMNINTNQKNYLLEGYSLRRQIRLKAKVYHINILKAEIRRRDKNPYHKSKVTMVLWEERENAPVLIKIFASGLLINARLIDIR